MKTVNDKTEFVVFLHRNKKENLMDEQAQKKLCKGIFSGYTRHGETLQAVEDIQDQLQILSKSCFDLKTLQEKNYKQLQKTKQTGIHYIERIVDNEELTISLHSIPDNYEIPAHCHPGMLSITYVLSGKLSISQSSLSAGSRGFQHVVNEIGSEKACVGLKNFRNIHKLNSMDEPCSYLSMRVQQKIVTQKRMTNLFSWLVSGALLWTPGFASDLQKGEYKSIKPVNILKISSQIKVQLANQLHWGIHKEKDDYRAAELYLQAAKDGNPEAQYRLGVMYLEGMGVTDDSEEAYKWIATAADQAYKPAIKLQHYLLTTSEVLDC